MGLLLSPFVHNFACMSVIAWKDAEILKKKSPISNLGNGVSFSLLGGKNSRAVGIAG